MNANWVLLGVTAALSGVLLVATNLITHERAPDVVVWVFSSPVTFWSFAALFGLPSLLLALYAVLRILHKVRRDIFGGRLSMALTLILAAMAAIPVLLVYQSSSAAILRNIDSWFNVELDDVFDEGLEVARRQMDRSLDELEDQAREIARQYNIFERRNLSSIAVDYGFENIEIISGQNLGDRAAAGGLLENAPAGSRRLVKRFYEGYLLEVTVPIEGARPGLAQSVLRVSARLPIWLDRSVENLSKGKVELDRLKALRRQLKKTFTWSLLITTLAVLCVSVSLAAILGETLSRPLSSLANAHQAVARGDFSQRPPERGISREITTLMDSFGRMSEQLEQARRNAQNNKARLEESNSYLETLLSNLSAGVVVFGPDGPVTKVNASACALLDEEAENLVGKPVDRWGDDNDRLGPFVEAARECMDAARRESPAETQSAEARSAEIKVGDRRLVVSARRLPLSTGGGTVLIIDDITRPLAANEEKAWLEASKQFAHEIRNPLTPIRLAAERIEKKFADKLAPDDRGALSDYVHKIVEQVDTMKEMVDNFRLDQHLESALEPLRLNAALADVLDLYRYRAGGISRTFTPDDPLILGNSMLIRQLVVNLVNNSVEAAADESKALIDIRTASTHNHASISVQDNCGGIPDEILDNAFEAQMTTKPKGTGLGLLIVRRIVERMSGRIRIANSGEGLLTTIEIPLHHG